MDDKEKNKETNGGNSNKDGTQDAVEPSPPPRTVNAQQSLSATEKQVLSKRQVKPKSVTPLAPPPSQYRTAVEPPPSPTPKRQQQALEPGTSAAEANLRSTEKQVLSKKQVKPISVKPTQPAPPQYRTSTGDPPPQSPRPLQQQALEPGTPTRSSAEVNLRNTEKHVLSKKQVKPKSITPVEPAPSNYRTATEPPPQSPRP